MLLRHKQRVWFRLSARQHGFQQRCAGESWRLPSSMADSILIDEARTPLVISGAVDTSEIFRKLTHRLIPKLNPELEEQNGDFTVDEKHRSIELTEAGHEKVEGMLIGAGLLQADDSLYAATNLGLLHHVHSGLRAHVLFHKDVEYIVQEGQVVLIDEHTAGHAWQATFRGLASGD